MNEVDSTIIVKHNELFQGDRDISIEPEGYDNSNQGLGDDYPLDSVLVRSSNMSISDVMKRIQDKRWIMDPDFQREFVWEKQRQSRLVESCIMRIPLPVFYLAEDNKGKIIVVDGLQRLSTLYSFTQDEFKLTGLGKGEAERKQNSPLLGKRFSDLPLHLQERILDTQLTLYILDKNAPSRAKLDIFDRVNSGVPLSRQQMRNSLYSGQATTFLSAMSKKDYFLGATGESLNTKSMRDREAINRFCGFLLRRRFYTGDMDTFLADTLDTMNNMTEVELEDLGKKFEVSMRNNFYLFGEHSFRKSISLLKNPFGGGRSVINIALFDVFSVLLSDFSYDATKRNKDFILDSVINLLHNDESFVGSITMATNDKWRVMVRFEKIEEILSIIEN